MTDNEIIKAGECIKGEKALCLSCPYRARFPDCKKYVIRDIFALASRQEAEIEALQMENKQLQSDVITANQYYEHTKEQLEKAIKISQRSNQRFKEAKKELNETQEKLEALLCEATGGMLSKHTYTAEAMITQAHEHLLKCCYDEVKEFAEGLKKKTYPFPCAVGVENAVTVRAINEYVEEYCG